MWRMIKALIFLGVIGAAGLAGYAFLADLSPDQSERRETVVLDGR